MTTLFRQPGLRPAQAPAALPPTLQPHAVLSLAPPTDRARSAAFSAAIYALLAGGLVLMARARAATIPPKVISQGTEVIFEPARADESLLGPPHRVIYCPRFLPPLIPPGFWKPINLGVTPANPPVEQNPTGPDKPQGPPVEGLHPSSTGGTLSVSMEVVHVLHRVEPIYPPMAKMAHLQGTVILRMTIDDQGVPASVDAVSGPAALQASAIRAAQQWRFEAARQNGQAVPATFLLTLNFVLR